MAKKALDLYRKKRDFKRTAEPSGDVAVAADKALRFVIQKHDARRLHYDFRLELDGVFKSWAVTRGPSLDPADKRLAVEVEDHPLDYGDFEGTIPAGEYGGGTVQLWDRGFWTPEGSLTPQQALEKGDLKFTLEGKRLRGSWVLVRMRHDRSGGKRTNWLLIKHRDEAAQAGQGEPALLAETSVASGRTLEQIAAGRGKAPQPFMLARQRATADAVWHSNRSAAPPAAALKSSKAKPERVKSIPKFVEPQLAKLSDAPPAQGNWIHEVKFDGYRMQLLCSTRSAALRTRTGLDWTDRFADIAVSARKLGPCMLDGEVVALDKAGNPSFSALQAALSARDSSQLVYYLFDALFIGHDDLRNLPLVERKSRLRRLLDSKGKPLHQIRYVDHFDSDGESVLQSACRMGLEGIISKRPDASYQSGRSTSWLKSKCRGGHEVVLGGWTDEEDTVRSLMAGVYRDGELVYAGKIGTGFGRDVVKMLLPKLRAATRVTSPFAGENAPRALSTTRWLKPALVAEIEFAGWTDGGMIRQASFKGLREDKPARQVVAEVAVAGNDSDARQRRSDSMQNKRPAARTVTKRGKTAPKRPAAAKPSPNAAEVMGVTISKPDKALWPDDGKGQPVTKLDLAHYYEAVGEWLLPHIEGRPCSLVRAPDGIAGQQFFQRHAMAGISELFNLVKVKGDREPYVEIDRVEALAAVAQTAALELHPWNNVPHEFEYAGRLVFDLDPAPDLPFERVIRGALEIRERLEALGLKTFCKTTGGKGLHVVTPLSGGKQAVAWPDAKNFAHLVCTQMARDSPDRYLDVMTKSRRTGRIFLDYLRNDRMSTAVAPLSSRARPGATVSMPVEWRQVKKGLDPAAFTVTSTPALLERTKPWKDYARSAMPLRKAIEKLTRG